MVRIENLCGFPYRVDTNYCALYLPLLENVIATLEYVWQSSDTMKGSLYRYNDIFGAQSYLDHIYISDLVDLALTEGQFIYLIAYLNSTISSKDLILLGTYLDTFQEFSYNYDYLKNNFFF